MQSIVNGLPTRLWRDWRVRTLVPVLLIHVAAFAALYVVMDHFAISNLLHTQRFGAAILLDEVEFDFPDMMLNHHGASSLPRRMVLQADRHNLATLNVYDHAGRPFVVARGRVSPNEEAEARQVLAGAEHITAWQTDQTNGFLLLGTRTIENKAACRNCHESNAPHLGVLQLGVDLTEPLRDARARVRTKFGLVGGAWIALVALMSWIRMLVIGRPIADIQKSITAAGPNNGSPGTHDLTALAQDLHSTLWGLIQAQRQREADMARQMVRAEQLAALGELAAGLTHEIKNPLAGVIAALEIVRDETTDGEREMAEQMLAELRRVVGTLDSLLRLARPQPPQRTEVDLARVVREVASLFGARARRQGITLDVNIAGSTPMLLLDQGLMIQLLVNLLTNSIQATERGGTIGLLLAPFPRQDGVVLAVSDSGRGIDPEHLTRIFDPFFTTKEEGTGLGLAICSQIVKQHGGTITIESERGKGTRVVVLLAALAAAEFGEEEDRGDAVALAG